MVEDDGEKSIKGKIRHLYQHRPPERSEESTDYLRRKKTQVFHRKEPDAFYRLKCHSL